MKTVLGVTATSLRCSIRASVTIVLDMRLLECSIGSRTHLHYTATLGGREEISIRSHGEMLHFVCEL